MYVDHYFLFKYYLLWKYSIDTKNFFYCFVTDNKLHYNTKCFHELHYFLKNPISRQKGVCWHSWHYKTMFSQELIEKGPLIKRRQSCPVPMDYYHKRKRLPKYVNVTLAYKYQLYFDTECKTFFAFHRSTNTLMRCRFRFVRNN